jgi:hypothetical protein
MARKRNYLAGAVVGVFFLYAPTATRCDTPRDELLRLVPEDVGICMIIQNLGETVNAVRGSALFERARSSTLGTALTSSAEFQKLRDVEQFLKTQLDAGSQRLLDDVLGDAIVLAFWPGTSEKPDNEQGIVLVRARDPQLLATIMERLPSVAHASGNAPPRENRPYEGTSYSVWHDGKKTAYTYMNGPIAAITHHENLIQRIISRERGSARNEHVISGQLRRLGMDKAVAAVWLNARAFDSEIAKQTAAAPDIDAGVRSAILSHWKAVEGLALSAEVGDKDVTLGLAVLAQSDKLPESSRLFFKPGQVSELWSWFPENAMLTVAGRIDTVGITQMLSGFLDENGRKAVREAMDRYAKGSIGRDVEREVFPALGPDWGFCVVAPPKEEKGWQPYVLAALRIQPGTQDPPLDRALANFLNGLAMLGVVVYNSSNPDAVSLHTEMQDKVEVKYFVEEKKFPVGFRPAFAMKDGYLVVASSPMAIRLFHSANQKDKPRTTDGEVQWLRIAPGAIRQYLADRGSAIAAQHAAQEQVPLEEANKRLEALRELLLLVEHVDVTQRSTADQFQLKLRIRGAHSIRK